MEDYREIILDRRTKIIKDNNPIFIVYKMMRKIPYRSCIGTMRYRWFEVSRVYSDTVMEEYNMCQRLDPNTTYGDVLVGRGIPKTVIFRPNEGVVGAHYGAELAIAQEKVGSAVLVSNNIPQNSVDKLLICASLPGKTDKINAKEVIYFNAS